MEDVHEERSRKRLKLNNNEATKTNSRGSPITLTSSISPPPLRRKPRPETEKATVIKSPVQLTWIRDLPESSNKDTITIKDILGDPLIAECWEFNYLHNLDFLMDAFDQDVRNLVKVHVVHGFWKHEDQSRQNLKVYCLLFVCPLP